MAGHAGAEMPLDAMIPAGRCPACDSPLPADAPRDLCVECLIRLAEDPVSFPPVLDAKGLERDTSRTRFGDYELLCQIGRGGMGVVYEAWQISLKRTVALKIIPEAALSSSSAIRRFQIEAEAAAKLDHPNIVAIHEFGECGGLPFLVMQRIEGQDLNRQMTAFALPSLLRRTGDKNANKTTARKAQEPIAKLIATVARALQYAHERGIIHCDVKPGNILIDRTGEPHLTDFGIARILDYDGQLTKSGVMGTPRYMSPEQAAGHRDTVTAATDIYGLGVILYELLAGRTPFRGPTPHETLRQVMEREPTAPHDADPVVNRDLSTICLKCLEKNVRHRYGSAAELADDLERWMHREPILARRASLLERLVRWCMRKPATAGLSASVALLLATVAIVSTLFAWRLSLKENQLEAASRFLRGELNRALDQLWEHPERPAVRITSDKRLVLDNKPLRSEKYPGAVQRLTFGVYTFEKPSVMARKFTPLLGNLETFMADRLGRPAGIDFIIYRSYTLGHAGLLSGEVDFMRVGPASYVLMKERRPGISLLVAQNNVIRCEIFTKADSGIETVSELKGKAFAFGDPESTFGTYMAKVALLRAGIRADDLSADSRHFRSHDEVVEAVKSGRCAAGSANIVVIDPSLKVLHTFSNVLRMPFIARDGIDPVVAQALKDALRAEDSPFVLTNLVPNLTAYCEVSDQDYDGLREEMKLAAEFGELKH